MRPTEVNLEKMETQLKQWAVRIDRLAIRAAHAGARAGIEYRLTIDDLKVKRAVVQTKFDEFKASGVEKREELRAGMERVCRDLEIAFRDLRL